MFKELLPENLYHSYVIEGEVDILSLDLISFLKERGDIVPKNSDILFQNYDSFTINDSNFIKKWNSEKSVGSKKICIICAKSITFEAQNSLLKIFEEPMVDTHFFIIIPNADILLATLLSRVHILKIKKDENIIELKRSKEFVNANQEIRIDMITKIIKNHENDENSASLRDDALNLLNNIENIIYKIFLKDRNNKGIQFSLSEIQKCREFLSTQGASVKMILEHIALVI